MARRKQRWWWPSPRSARSTSADRAPDAPRGQRRLRLHVRRQWSLNFATSTVGKLNDVTALGDFKNGRIDFYDQEPLNGRSILVRFSVYATGPTAHVSEQAFSADGGKT